MNNSNIYSFVMCGSCGCTEFKNAKIVSIVPQEEKIAPYLLTFNCCECGTKIYTSFVGGRIVFQTMDGQKVPKAYKDLN